jgi:hypothetical protein
VLLDERVERPAIAGGDLADEFVVLPVRQVRSP